jgi:putative ABC transport system permease protein
MQCLGEMWRRLAFFFRRGRLQRDLEEEMREHVRMRAEALQEEGMPPEEARYAARREFGNALLLREKSRDAWGLAWLEILLQDLRYGLRQLRRNPGLTAVAVLSLALGIGANTAIFSVIDDLVLRPLPHPTPHRLVALSEVKLDEPGTSWGVAQHNFMDWKKRSKSFDEMALASWFYSGILEGPNGAQFYHAVRVTNSYFQILGARTSLGRLFLPEEYAEYKGKGGLAVVLSNAGWRRIFNSDPDILGKTVKVTGYIYTVVGIMSPDYHTLWGDNPDLWLPVTWRIPSRKGRYYGVIGRLKKGTDVRTAQAEMDVIARQIGKDDPDAAGFGVSVHPLQEWMYGDFVRSRLLPMFGAVLFILLIACANVASLMLARATARDKEFAIRCAVGGGRARLVRQLLTESTLLAVLGAGLGALLAYTGVTVMIRLAPAAIPTTSQVAVNLRVLGFTLLVALLTGLLFGLLPALVASKPSLNESLKETGRRATPGFAGRGANGVLLVAEVALSLILLIGAGLMIRNTWRLLHLDIGFNTNNLITMTIRLPDLTYYEQLPTERRLKPQAVQVRKQIRERLQVLPGIRTVSITNYAPLRGCPARIIGTGGQPPPAVRDVNTQNLPWACFQAVSPDYLRTLQVPLLKGRELTEQDNQGSPRVALVNETFARRYLPAQDPLDKVVRIGYWDNSTEDAPRQIVGVVGDSRQMLVRDPNPALYVPYSQLPPEFQGAGRERTTIAYVARTSIDPASLVPAMRRVESKVAPDVPIVDIKTVNEIRKETLQELDIGFYEWLLIVFAGIAVVLTVVGVFGVTSYSVSRRTHEIGIRMAMGGQKSDVLRMVVWRGLKLALIGIGLGIGGAFEVTRFLSSLLYGVKPTDPLTFISVSLILIAVALLACYIPARRAAQVDPMVALRYE